MQHAKENFKVQVSITSLSVVLFVLKFIAYFMTHSLSILSEALESIVNVLAGAIGSYSLYIASKPKDKDHPYGHGKAEFVSAAFEGSLIIAAGVIIIYEAIDAIIHPITLHDLTNGMSILLTTALINFIAGFITKNKGKKNKSIALVSSGQHLIIDSITTFVVTLAVAAVLVTNINGIDAIVALFMGFWIIYNGYKIIRESLAGIMDEADLSLIEEVIAELNKSKYDQWIDLHNLRMVKYGAMLHIDCHLTVPWYINVNEAHACVDSFSTIIQNKFGNSVEFFVHTDGCMPFSCAICNLTNCQHRKHEFKQKIEWNLENVISNNKHQL